MNRHTTKILKVSSNVYLLATRSGCGTTLLIRGHLVQHLLIQLKLEVLFHLTKSTPSYGVNRLKGLSPITPTAPTSAVTPTQDHQVQCCTLTEGNEERSHDGTSMSAWLHCRKWEVTLTVTCRGKTSKQTRQKNKPKQTTGLKVLHIEPMSHPQHLIG